MKIVKSQKHSVNNNSTSKNIESTYIEHVTALDFTGQVTAEVAE